MKKLPDLESLMLFTKVVDAGSFARVCQMTQIPKATLSRKITLLEEELGAQLLLRTTRKLALTDVGQEFYSYSLAVLAKMDEALSAVSQAKTEPKGRLRMTAGVEFGLCVLNSIVNSFCEKHPNVEIELDLTGRYVDLLNEGFDLAIRIGPLADSSLLSKKLGSFSYGLFASPAYLKKYGMPKSPEDLQNHPALVFSRKNHNEFWRLVAGQKEIKVYPKARMQSNNLWVLRNAAAAGLGIVFMPKFLVLDKAGKSDLVQILPKWNSAEIAIHAVAPGQRFLPSKVRLFLDYLAAQILKKQLI